MRLKILVFDQEQSLRELLRNILVSQGHEVMAFGDPSLCPVYGNLLDKQCCCPREHPCADAVLIDTKMPGISALDFLKLQRRRGCKALDANKAVMSASMTRELEEAVQKFGAHHIKKPFHLVEIRSWVRECADRLAARQQPQPGQ